MISRSDLERAISGLEKSPSTFQDCQKLATFYTLYDHLYGQPPQVTIPKTEEKIGTYGETDFLVGVSGMDAGKAWALVDELMAAVKVTNPRLYDSVMRKIAE